VAAAHPVPSLGCVLAHDGKRAGYTGDTAYFDRLAAAYASVDLLIHEATKLDDPAADASYRIAHSTAGDAGRVAAAAGVGRLILTHLGPQTHDAPHAALAEAQSIFAGRVDAAEDLLAVGVI
jgi:ribonuclease BN (tRNA processing enzyme)